MPWTVDNVDGFKKGLSDKGKEQWVAVANSALASCLEDDGDQAECEASAIRQANSVVAEQRDGQGQDNEPQGDGGVDMCVCPECGYEMEHERGTPCNEIECPECGAMMGPMEETVNDLEELRELLAKALDMIDSKISEQVAELAESASGHVLGLAEAQLPLDGNRAPVEVDLKIIAPGAGNKRDNHWYPADMLRRDAHVFEGVDVFVTDHRENERSERTKVGKIKTITGFTEDGGPIGRMVIYDPELAEKTRNRAAASELETLHCSILASGRTKKGKIDGRRYHIVEAITSADAVDLVSRAGAGGRALSLAESEHGGESMADEEQVIEEADEELEEATLQEQQEPEEEAPAPAMLEQERVAELVGESNLPDASKARLSEAEYADESEVKDAVSGEIAYLKEVMGSGKPFAQGASDPPPEHKPRTAEEADADWKRILGEVGMPYLGGVS